MNQDWREFTFKGQQTLNKDEKTIKIDLGTEVMNFNLEESGSGL